jgi:hypothetical protein
VKIEISSCTRTHVHAYIPVCRQTGTLRMTTLGRVIDANKYHAVDTLLNLTACML